MIDPTRMLLTRLANAIIAAVVDNAGHSAGLFRFGVKTSRPHSPSATSEREPLIEQQSLSSWEDTMIKHLTLAALTAASLAGNAGVASAQPWGGGYYDDDRGPYRHRYRDRDYYDRDRYDRRRDYRERRGYRTGSGCRPGFTVQDGVCKPYTGR